MIDASSGSIASAPFAGPRDDDVAVGVTVDSQADVESRLVDVEAFEARC